VDAVKRFQDRHALEPDGVIGPGTLAAVNVPLAARVRQIELALERIRWVPALPARPTIVVNVPLFLLYAFDWDDRADPMKMRVVTGKSAGHETPLFMEQMRYVVFRPYWNPPPSILRKEILPRARKDPTYLDRQNMEIVASGEDDAPSLPATPANLDKVAAGKLVLRQRPGPKNSLGLAKFIFPNANNVYMHGTPAKQLFSRARRDYSHGCIRVEDPPRLAEWVLRSNADWDRARIEEAMAGERPTQVNLADHVTVIIFYDTVTVDPDGVVHFGNDYYGHDARLEAALRRPG
jgi:murein L,D-transpeptidase YcbB/YkuD